MLQLLRAELVRGWFRDENPPDTDTVLVFLIAFERVSDRMDQSADLSDFISKTYQIPERSVPSKRRPWPW